MKTKTNYGIAKATPSLPAINLLKIPHKDGDLIVSFPAFGPNTFSANITEMQGDYSHSKELPKISFKEPTTSKSISAAVYDFENLAKPQIFDPRWLQLGRIVRTSEGVFVNPPKDEQGNSIINEKILKSYLNKTKKINNIYICKNNLGFAPYETFKQGVQDYDTFSRGGLARGLEHTKEEIAKNLKQISSPEFYKKGVNVWGFGEVKEPILRVASLGSDRCLGGVKLIVYGDLWDNYSDGYAFGVLDKSAEGASQNF